MSKQEFRGKEKEEEEDDNEEQEQQFDPMQAAATTLVTRKRLIDYKDIIIDGFMNMQEDEIAQESTYYQPDTNCVCLFGGLAKFLRPDLFKDDKEKFDMVASCHGKYLDLGFTEEEEEKLHRLDTRLSDIHNHYERNHDTYHDYDEDDDEDYEDPPDDSFTFDEMINEAVETVEEYLK